MQIIILLSGYLLSIIFLLYIVSFTAKVLFDVTRVDKMENSFDARKNINTIGSSQQTTSSQTGIVYPKASAGHAEVTHAY